MPTVIASHELVEYSEYITTPAAPSEQPGAHGARKGFWRTLAYRLVGAATPASRACQMAAGGGQHPFEAPMDRLVREHPSLSLHLMAMV